MFQAKATSPFERGLFGVEALANGCQTKIRTTSRDNEMEILSEILGIVAPENDEIPIPEVSYFQKNLEQCSRENRESDRVAREKRKTREKEQKAEKYFRIGLLSKNLIAWQMFVKIQGIFGMFSR